MARRPGGAPKTRPRPVTNRRHGAPAPSSPSMMAARRSRAARLRCRAPPVDRQHPAAPSRNHAPASTRPVDARLGPVRPRIGAQTCLRAAIDPTAHPESAARRASVVRSARLRPVRSALSRLSAADQRSVGCDSALNPGPGRSMPPLRPVGSPSSCPAAACADPSGTPGTHTPAPRSVPGTGRNPLCTYGRACGVEIFRKKNQRKKVMRLSPRGD